MCYNCFVIWGRSLQPRECEVKESVVVTPLVQTNIKHGNMTRIKISYPNKEDKKVLGKNKNPEPRIWGTKTCFRILSFRFLWKNNLYTIYFYTLKNLILVYFHILLFLYVNYIMYIIWFIYIYIYIYILLRVTLPN